MAHIDWTAARVPACVARLSNGLTAVAHRDAKAPLVAVYVAYRAGSRDEPESKAGLAHLCEHLMYTGTARAPGSYFAPFEEVGAARMNAYVREDYSAYFATVPAWALDFALRMEADRMANLAESLDAVKVDRQREVVRNELRQRESEPFGCATRIIAELAHPRGHPYAHPPDGLIEQLDNISVEDVREWIGSRHCAANAVVVIAGDIDPEAAIENVQRHFDSLEPGRTRTNQDRETSAATDGVQRRVVEEPGRQDRLYINWNGPRFASADDPVFEVACELVGGGKSSRLRRRAVETERLALEGSFRLRPRQLGCQAVLSITAAAGVRPAAIEAAVQSELARLSNGDADPQEVEAARLRIFARLVRDFQRLGGPDSKSDALGVATMLGGNPDAHNERLAAIATAGPEAIAAAVGKWLGVNRAVLEMRAIG